MEFLKLLENIRFPLLDNFMLFVTKAGEETVLQKNKAIEEKFNI